jgi:hypothetical protein
MVQILALTDVRQGSSERSLTAGKSNMRVSPLHETHSSKSLRDFP